MAAANDRTTRTLLIVALVIAAAYIWYMKWGPGAKQSAATQHPKTRNRHG